MVCCDLLFYWIRSEYREHIKHRKLMTIETDLNQIESQDEVDGEIEQVKKYDRSIENQLMCVWALIEMSLMAIVLFLKTNDDHPINFLSAICKTGCQETINKMIAVRIITALMLFIGARMVRMGSLKSFLLIFIIFFCLPFFRK